MEKELLTLNEKLQAMQNYKHTANERKKLFSLISRYQKDIEPYLKYKNLIPTNKKGQLTKLTNRLITNLKMI